MSAQPEIPAEDAVNIEIDGRPAKRRRGTPKGEDGRAILMDFGLARRAEDAPLTSDVEALRRRADNPNEVAVGEPAAVTAASTPAATTGPAQPFPALTTSLSGESAARST